MTECGKCKALGELGPCDGCFYGVPAVAQPQPSPAPAYMSEHEAEEPEPCSCEEALALRARIAELEVVTANQERIVDMNVASAKAANARADAAEQEVTFANNRARQACEDYEGIQKSLNAERAKTARLLAERDYNGEHWGCTAARLAAATELLERIVKYAREDNARTPGVTRLARALSDAAAFLFAQPAPAKGEP